MQALHFHQERHALVGGALEILAQPRAVYVSLVKLDHRVRLQPVLSKNRRRALVLRHVGRYACCVTKASIGRQTAIGLKRPEWSASKRASTPVDAPPPRHAPASASATMGWTFRWLSQNAA